MSSRVIDDRVWTAHQMTANCNQHRKLMFEPKMLEAEETEMNPEHLSPKFNHISLYASKPEATTQMFR